MVRTTVAVVLTTLVIGLVALVHAQSERVTFGRGVRRNSMFGGRADRSNEHISSRILTYEGNVKIFFDDANIVVHADELTFERDSRQLTFKGDVRITLDERELPQ